VAESEELEICEHVIMRLSGGRSISRLVQRSDKASISWHFFDLSSHPSNLRVLINSHCHNLKILISMIRLKRFYILGLFRADVFASRKQSIAPR